MYLSLYLRITIKYLVGTQIFKWRKALTNTRKGKETVFYSHSQAKTSLKIQMQRLIYHNIFIMVLIKNDVNFKTFLIPTFFE